jgi:hypothetical protein
MRRLFVAAPAAIALTAGLFLVTATPAFANETCATAPAQLRTAAAAADASTAKRALRYVSTGEALCEAGNDRAAEKKFAAAMKALNVDSASLTAVTAAK